MRGCPKSAHRVVTERVDTVAIAIIVAAQLSPVALNAEARGVLESRVYQGCMPVTTKEAPTYSVLAIASVPRTPKGMSFFALGTSSESVVTASNPMKEKKT